MYCTEQLRISLAQIQSQIDVLNKDFNAANSDFNQVPTLFAGVKQMLESLLYLKQFTEKQLLKLHGYKRCNENCFSGWYCSTSPTTK
jgi:hypothetical protein